ncbi:SusC/RagA family TonB-linked outer membrane protein [Arcticibacterium luteifluviistationis]|nr:TonB-dependent receptor [Arcticibacterium luteifluviistationis]
MAICLIGLGFTLSSQAQTKQISGKVTDDSGDPLPGASITIKGTSIGSITNVEGVYTIASKVGDVLVCSFIGYESSEATVNGNTLNFSIAFSENNFDEVVVVGYGTRKKSDVTGSISSISSKDFKDQPIIRVEDALQGRAAGVIVSRTSGSPGEDVKVRIRGVNSITGNNDPLVVIDGIIGATLSALNPNDIESMEVLKDASATAIYGSRGSNGVILVTTKQGSSKPTFSVDYFTAISNVPKQLETLSAGDFANIENQRRISSGGSPIFTDSEVSGLRSSGGTNYQDLFFKTGVSHNVQLSTSGRAGKIGYFMSGNYANQDGIIINNGYKRLSGRLNLTSQINDKLKVGFNMFATNENQFNNLNDRREYQGSLITRALTYDPTTPVRDDNGAYIDFSSRALAHLGYNPIADMNTRTQSAITNRINTNLNLSYQFLESLNFTAIGGFGSSNGSTENYFTTPPLPSANYSGFNSSGIQLSNILTWNKTMGIHDLKVTGVYEIQEGTNKSNGYFANNITVPGGFYLAELNQAAGINNDYSKSGIVSQMVRAEYILKDNLFVTGTVRRDQSSRFRDGFNTGIFPSVAVGYSLTDLPFMKENTAISALKIRAGWGQVGNQNIAPYSTYPSVNINSKYLFDGAQVTPGSSPDGYGNPELTWETTTQSNIGIDVGLFNQRLNLTVDAYQKNTTDLLLQVPVPNFAGGGSVLRNVGEVKNHGVDLNLGGAVINTGGLRWDANLSVSFIKNEVLSLGGPDEIQGSFDNIDGSGRPLNVIQVGQPIGQFYGETFLGTWKTSEAAEATKYGAKPGDAKYQRGADGNIILGAIGNGTPTYSWGFNNTFSYKNFDANIFINGMGGYNVLNVVDGILVGATGNQRSFLSPVQLNQWTPENETEIPVGGQNRTASSRYVEDGTFARLNNLSIGYTLKDIGKIPSIRIYASGQNLVLLTKYTGYDPEGSDKDYDNGNSDSAAGVNVGAYPNPRVLTFGVKFNL